jgi:integrase/recombinase XerD
MPEENPFFPAFYLTRLFYHPAILPTNSRIISGNFLNFSIRFARCIFPYPMTDCNLSTVKMCHFCSIMDGPERLAFAMDKTTPLYNLIDDFIAAGKAEQGYTRATVRTYRPHLRAFVRWCAQQQKCALSDVLPSVLTKSKLGIYLEYLKEKPAPKQIGLRPRTIRSYFAALNSFCDWLISEKYLKGKNPVLGIRLPTLDDPDQRLLSLEEVQAMIEACDKVTPYRRRVMAKAMLHTFCCALLRRNEFLNIKVADLHFGPRKDDNYILVLKGKGNRRGKSLLPTEAVAALQEWIVEREKMGVQHDFVWVRNKTQRAGDDIMEGILEQVAAIAGIDNNPNVVPHALRHGGASNMLANGASIKEIQLQLRHRKVATTYEYLHADDKQRAATIETASWRRQEPLLSPPPLPAEPDPDEISPPALPPVNRDVARRRNEAHRRFQIQRLK